MVIKKPARASFFIPSSIDCKIYPTNQTRRGSRKRPTRRCQRRKRRFDSYVPSISPSGFYLALRSTPWFHLNAIGAPCCCKVSAPTRESAKEIGGPGLGSTPGASCPKELCPKSRLPPLSLRLAPSAGEPLPNTVSETETNDQNDCSFQH